MKYYFHLLIQKNKFFTKETFLIFLLVVPIICKIDQLAASKIPYHYWFTGFNHELLLSSVVVFFLFLVRRKSFTLVPVLLVAILLVVDILILLSNTVYHNFGLFYKHGVLAHMPLSNQVNMVISYVTAPLLYSAFLRLMVAYLAAVLISILWKMNRHLFPPIKRKTAFIVVITQMIFTLLISFAWPHSLDEQELSVWLSLKTFIPVKEIELKPDRNLLKSFLNGNLKHHTAKNPASLELPKRDKPYNLVVYSMESTRAISSSAYEGKTNTAPFLVSMKNKGLFFENAYSNAVRSIKSLIPLLLGEYPYFKIDSWAWGHLSSHIDYARTLPNILKKNGFFTSFFVNSHLEFDQRNTFLPKFNFDFIQGAKEFISMDDGVMVDKLDELFNLAAQNDQPLLAFLLSSSAHSPFKYPEFPDDNGKIDMKQAKQEAVDYNISKDNNYHDIRYPSYLRSIRHQDDVAELLYTYLREKNLLKDTILVVLGDHGESFGEHGNKGGIAGHGNSLYEESVKIPLWIHHPDIEPRIISNPVQFLDLMPTWLAMLDIHTKQKYVGRNILVEPRKQLYFFNFVKSKTIAMIDYPYKLIRNGKKKRQYQYELYNIQEDPRERVNILRNTNSIELKRSLTEFDYFLPTYQKQYIHKKLRTALRSPIDPLKK